MMLSMEVDALNARMAQSPLFEATFELVSCALVLLDDLGRILKVNTVFIEQFGYSAADLSGVPFAELIHPADRVVPNAVKGHVLPWRLVDQPDELSYRHKDGTLLCGRSKLAIVGAFLLVEIVPVEAPKSLDEFLEQDHWLQRITETAPGIIGTLRLGSDGTYSMPWISPGYEKYYGVTVQELERDVGILFERLHPDDGVRLQETIAESARSMAPWHCEYRVRHPQKGDIWLEGRAKPTLEADGSIIWFGFLHDISERKGVEQALLESEERFRLAFESTAIGMALLALDGRWLRVNPHLCEMLGRSEDEFLQTTSESLIHPDDLSRAHADAQRLIMGEVPYVRLEKRYQHRDGRYLRVHLTASMIRAKDDSPLYFVIQIEDLSRLIEAQERVSLMDFALSHVQEAAFLLDEQARFHYVNDQACRRLGYSREELLCMTVADIDPNWSNERLRESWFDASKISGRSLEIIESYHRTKAGAIFPVEISVSHFELDGQRYNLALARDISERKRLQAAQWDTERRYREIFDNSSDCLYLLEVTEDQRFRCLEVNQAFKRSSGFRREQLIGQYVGESSPEQTARKVLIVLERCLASGESIEWEDELELPAGNIAVLSTFIPVRDEQGKIYRIVGISRDITERKQMENRLLTSEQEFRALVENTPDVIARFDLQNRILYANPAAQRMFGCPLSFLLGKKTCEVAPDLDQARFFQNKLEYIIRTCKVTEEEISLDVPAKQGAKVTSYQVRLVPERDQHEALVSVLAVGRNVSAMRAAEQRLKESHAQLRQLSSYRETTREEERKRIAREIHDELGQQLTALRMGISLLRLQFGSEQPALVERVQVLMGRIDETIQVVRNVATSLRPSALNMGLISALEWLVSEFSHNAGIACRLRAPSARLELDDERATAIFRVIQESLTNVARHAHASRVDIHLECSAEHVLIEVRDNGRGFDPKQLSKGTLGMLGMRERGHMLGGTVTVDSAPGQGACVQVNIPFQVDPEAL
ncbi:PAS domain S-box protein [Pseudomonas baetica]|uniref:sensor histidine kinase n=1 Tax=Pseudomonas baetica TaxID=674054 RepID=UPI003EEC24CF